MSLYLLLVSLCFIIYSDARPDGAPKTACSDLLPRHSGIGVQRGTAPYTVTAVKQGNKVRVTISSNNEDFQGFMLQARSSDDRSKFVNGEFTSSTDSKTIGCFGLKKNTLTQVNTDPKSEIITEWTPHGSVNEEIVFRATVAKTFGTFWEKVDSKPLRVKGENSMSSTELGSNRADSMYDDCYRTKGCFGMPSGCVSSGDCEILLTYTKADDGIEFAMHANLEPSTYMAMGISDDASMGDDSVTECFRDGSSVVARESWNNGKRNTNPRELPRTYRLRGSYTNSLTSCSWNKPYRSESNGRRYDMLDRNYYVLLAKGSLDNRRVLGYHTDKLASAEAVNFTAFENIGGQGVHDAIKIHGTFMVTAWVGFVSMAILLARHFKNTWENSTLGGVKIWFALHRGFMLAALVLFVIAFLVIFLHNLSWNFSTHAVLGCIAVALGIFNPIMALCRPGPDHKKRPVFNWLHWAVGNAAHLIAIITIFFAVSLPSSGLNKSFYWVMGIFVIVHLIFHLLYEVHSWSQLKKKNNDVGMNEMNGSSTNGHNAQSAQAKNVSDNVFRILLLGIYCIFLLIILIALYSLIGVA